MALGANAVHPQALRRTHSDKLGADRRGAADDSGRRHTPTPTWARRAIEFYDQHLEIARAIGDRCGEGNALGNLGVASAALGEPRRAVEFYEQCLEIARAMGDRRGEANACWNMGVAYEKLGDLPRAAELMQVLVDYERELRHAAAEKRAGELAALRARLK
jgi:tetratricopeptide (TPR) repeat protein